jgi:hypothetical protein
MITDVGGECAQWENQAADVAPSIATNGCKRFSSSRRWCELRL